MANYKIITKFAKNKQRKRDMERKKNVTSEKPTFQHSLSENVN